MKLSRWSLANLLRSIEYIHFAKYTISFKTGIFWFMANISDYLNRLLKNTAFQCLFTISRSNFSKGAAVLYIIMSAYEKQCISSCQLFKIPCILLSCVQYQDKNLVKNKKGAALFTSLCLPASNRLILSSRKESISQRHL